MITRRDLMKGAATLAFSGAIMGGYAFAEPYRLAVRRYKLSPHQWQNGPGLRIVALADFHICEPWMPLDRVRQIVDSANALQPDLIVLLGDFITHHRLVSASVPHAEWANVLSDLSAPLGRYAVLGNHDWWEVSASQYTRTGPTYVGAALQQAGIPVLENQSLRLMHNGRPFWLSGLGDQWAFWLYQRPDGTFVKRSRMRDKRRHGYQGVDNLPATLASLGDDAPAILLAHEPDIFPEVPARYALTLSGHTHGGQVQLFGWAPVVPSTYGRRFVYGHTVEPDAAGYERNLIVSGGLGCSGLPIRFGRPPELVVVDVSPPTVANAGA